MGSRAAGPAGNTLPQAPQPGFYSQEQSRKSKRISTPGLKPASGLIAQTGRSRCSRALGPKFGPPDVRFFRLCHGGGLAAPSCLCSKIGG